MEKNSLAWYKQYRKTNLHTVNKNFREPRDVYHNIGNSSLNDNTTIIRTNSLRNCPITQQDRDSRKNIWSRCQYPQSQINQKETK